MNNLPDDRTRLLAETLEGEWATGPAAAMARRAAAHARGRRRLRRASLTCALVAVFSGLFFLRQHTLAPATAPAATVVTAPRPAYEIISDEELLATLKDRPLLVLPQENGPQKIVVLDR
jgi:hypothetical protein